jgi:uncharacterized protein
MPTYAAPGVYREDLFLTPTAELPTGVPAFLGFTERAPQGNGGEEQFGLPQVLTRWPEFVTNFGPPVADSYLAAAVRGFFENGGSLCYVVPLRDDGEDGVEHSLRKGLAALASLDSIDLVCAPDIMRPPTNGAHDPDQVRTLQMAVLSHCDTLGDRFALLDPLPGTDMAGVIEQRQGLRGTNGALYFPWVGKGDELGNVIYVPPCGHVAGVYSRSDDRVGVHKAPANELLQGVLDLAVNVSDAQQGVLNPLGINALRAFPGRGIRVWGARTLSSDPAWTYISVRRLFLTAARWIERNLASAVFEPNDPRLWARIERELTAYFTRLFQQGALRGATPQEAFYVKCDAETNPPEVREGGRVVSEIGLAPGLPGEIIVVRIIHGASGVTVSGPEA